MVRRWVKAGDRGSAGKAVTSESSESISSRRSRVNVVWHKWSDLRLLDHEPLWRAHAQPEPVLHVHLVELPLLSGASRVARIARCSPRRAQFWRQAVEDLAGRLAERNQHLVVKAVQDPAEYFSELCERLAVAKVFAHREFCDEELQTEAAVRAALARHGAELDTCWGALTVHHIDDLGFDASDRKQMPLYKGEFQKAAKWRPIREVLPIPPLRPPPAVAAELGASVEETFGAEVPEEERQTFRCQGGESAALDYLRNYMESGQLPRYRGATESFAHGDDNPVNGGTRLSPWLAFGCLSARVVVKEDAICSSRHVKKGAWYVVDYAKTGRSTCKEFRCKKAIAEGELRIGIEAPEDLKKLGAKFNGESKAWVITKKANDTFEDVEKFLGHTEEPVLKRPAKRQRT
ncbi:unnamed protein product [Effrenium voratum]|nr:unnamed protein product [Effrenium voratum]